MMRKRQTFVLTILDAENETTSFCGRVKVIANGKTYNFTNLDELHDLIKDEMKDNEPEDRQGAVPRDCTLKAIDATGSVR